MANSGRRWTIQDRYGNPIYLTQERWEHIIGEANHPELEDYEDYLIATINNRGRRRQEPLNPRKYRYYQFFDDLSDEVNHIVVIVLFGFDIDEHGQSKPNNYIATAFFKYIRPKG